MGGPWLLLVSLLVRVAAGTYIGHVEMLFFAPDDVNCAGDAHLGEFELSRIDECIEATPSDPANGQDALRLKVGGCQDDQVQLSLPCSEGCGSCMVETTGFVDGCVLVSTGDVSFRYMVHSLMCPSIGEEGDALAAAEGEEDPHGSEASMGGYENVTQGYFEVPEDLVASVLLVDAANPPVESLEGCARICSLAELCVGFTFDMDTYRCWPFTEGVFDHPLKENNVEENIFTYKKAGLGGDARSIATEPQLQVNCDSEMADECFRRCLPCMDCTGSDCLDADENPCATCEECAAFVPCFFEQVEDDLSTNTAATTALSQPSTTGTHWSSSFNPCADPNAYDPSLPATEASCRDHAEIRDEGSCFSIGGAWDSEKGDCDIGENHTACALAGGYMAPMMCGEIALMYGETIVPETCDQDLGAGMTGRQMLYRAGVSCCLDGRPSAIACGPMLNPCFDAQQFTANVPLQYWCSGAAATLTEQACRGEGRYWDAEAKACSIETEAACAEHGLEWVARTCKDVMSYLEFDMCSVDAQQCNSQPQLMGGSTLEEVIAYYGDLCCGGNEATTLCTEPGSVPCGAEAPALRPLAGEQEALHPLHESVPVATPEWRPPTEVDCNSQAAEDCFERCGPCWVCEGGDCADADGQACADDCLIAAEGTCGAYASCVTQDILCPVGYANIAGICHPCDPGTFQPEFGSAECYYCPTGQFSAQAGSSECYACPRGRFADTEGATECASCQPGSYQAEFGRSACVQCELGTYADQEGSMRCLDCPEGYSSPPGSQTCIQGTAQLAPQGPDPCDCMERWEWGGQVYAGCAETPDMPGLFWCYARGAALCEKALGSEANFGLFWVECEAPQEQHETIRVLQGQCEDTPNFVDEQGRSCQIWEGQDCTKAVEDFGYSRQGEQQILNTCVSSCGFCEEAPECTANEDCYTADCNQPGWLNLGCNYGQCYTGTYDPLCEGQQNGLNLGNGQWCWDGRIDTRCTSQGNLAAGTVVLNYYAPDDAQCASLWSFMVYNFTTVGECIPNPAVPADWNWPTNDRYVQLAECEEGFVRLRTLCNSDCSQCEHDSMSYQLGSCLEGDGQDMMGTSVHYARCPARRSTSCVTLAPDVAQRVKAISCARWNDPTERWNIRLQG